MFIAYGGNGSIRGLPRTPLIMRAGGERFRLSRTDAGIILIAALWILCRERQAISINRRVPPIMRDQTHEEQGRRS
jgi:hypothetical protein